MIKYDCKQIESTIFSGIYYNGNGIVVSKDEYIDIINELEKRNLKLFNGCYPGTNVKIIINENTL